MSEVRKVIHLAKQQFIPMLARHGFGRHKTSNSFFREIGHLLQTVSFFGYRSGGSFRIIVDVWSPDFSDSDTPPSLTDIANATWLGGQLSPWQIDSGNGSWDIGTDNEIIASLREAEKLFTTIAMPWLDCLANDVSVLRAARNKGMASEVLARIEKRCATNVQPTHYPINANNWWSADDDQEFLAGGGQTLVDQLQALGFAYQGAPLMQFVRKQGAYVHVIRVDSVSAGIHAKVLIHVWTKWVAESVFGERQKPEEHYFAVNGGYLGTAGIDQGALAWFIAGPEAIRKTVPELMQAIQTHALPWFSATSNRDAYYSSIGRNALPTDRRAALLQTLAKHLPKDMP